MLDKEYKFIMIILQLYINLDMFSAHRLQGDKTANSSFEGHM